MSQKVAEQKKSVGVLVFLGDSAGNTAVLIRRGGHKRAGEQYEPESYAGVCQVTAHSKLLISREEETDAINRIIKKELGLGLHRKLTELGVIANIKLLSRVEKAGDESVATFGFVTDPRTFNRWVRTPDKTRKLLVRVTDLKDIMTTTKEDKNSVIDDKSIVMFPDELEALKAGFATFFK